MKTNYYQVLLIGDSLDNYIKIKEILGEIETFQVNLEWLRIFDFNLLCNLGKYYDLYLISNDTEKAIEWAKEIAPIPVILITEIVKEGIEALTAGVSDYLLKQEVNSHNLERSLYVSLINFNTKITLKKYQSNYQTNLAQQLEIQDQEHQELNKILAFKNQILSQNKQHYLILAEAVQVGLFHNDPQGNCIYINQKASEILDITIDECLKQGWVSRIHPEDRERVLHSWKKYFETKSYWENEYRFVHLDGTVIWVYAQAVFIYDEQGENIGSVGSLTDITQRKNLEEALRKSEQFFKDVAKNIPSAVIRYVLHPDHSDKLIYMNPACQDLWEVNFNVAHTNITILWQMVNHQDLHPLRKSILASAQTLNDWTHEWRITTPSGKQKWLRGIGKPEKLYNGDIVWNALIMDITQHKETELLLHQCAFYDPLTNLSNRTFFFDRLKQALKDERWNEKPEIAVFYLDLDGFKEINDNYGHSIGDLLLIEVSKRLLSCFQIEDTVSRLGGDEFAILVKGISEPEVAFILAEKIHSTLCQAFNINELTLKIKTSIGIAFYDNHLDEEENLTLILEKADMAMYRAKKLGAGKTNIFTPEMLRSNLTPFKNFKETLTN